MIGNKAVHFILIRIRILDPHWKKWIRILDLRWKKNPDSGSALEKNGFGFWICTGKRIRILDLYWKKMDSDSGSALEKESEFWICTGKMVLDSGHEEFLRNVKLFFFFFLLFLCWSLMNQFRFGFLE